MSGLGAGGAGPALEGIGGARRRRISFLVRLPLVFSLLKNGIFPRDQEEFSKSTSVQAVRGEVASLMPLWYLKTATSLMRSMPLARRGAAKDAKATAKFSNRLSMS